MVGDIILQISLPYASSKEVTSSRLRGSALEQRGSVQLSNRANKATALALSWVLSYAVSEWW